MTPKQATLAEIRARPERATPGPPVFATDYEFIANAPEDVAYLLERVEKLEREAKAAHIRCYEPGGHLERIERLEAENADLRRAVPLINDDGQTVWPSVHDNPTVLRAMLFDARARIEKLEAVAEAGDRLEAVLVLHVREYGCCGFEPGTNDAHNPDCYVPALNAFRAAIEAAQ